MKTRDEYRRAIQNLIDRENGVNSGPSAQDAYLKMHVDRFRRTLSICTHWVPDPAARVLDVGRSPLTGLLAGRYHSVSTLGFPLAGDPVPPYPITGQDGKDVPHISFDLTRAGHPEEWPDAGKGFDLIVYCETLEHMHIAPEFTLMLLGYLLSASGKLVLTTPNGVRLGNRLRLLLGRNPFERIRFFDQNPGHFREYTSAEMRSMAAPSGLRCLSSEVVNLYPRPWKSVFASGPFKSLGDNLVAVFSRQSD